MSETQPEIPVSEPTPETITPEPTTENSSPSQDAEGPNRNNGINGSEGVPSEPTAQPVEPLVEEVVSESAPEPATQSDPEPAPQPAPEPQVVASVFPISRARELLIKAREMIQFRKRKKLEKIMSLFLKQSSITNDDVQKLVYVSDATATRYLQQLEREGRIKKENAGKYLSYSRM